METDRKQFIIRLGLLANIFLAGGKIAVGILGQSPALLAEGINSTSDVAYYIVVSVFMRIATKPADTEHPQGHGQLESIGVVVVGAFVVSTAISVFWNSISTMIDVLIQRSDFVGASQWALIVGAGTIVVKIGLSLLTSQTGRRLGSSMLAALAKDHINDVFSASAATLGILLGRLGLVWVDPLAGALVALVILKTGVEILRDGSAALIESTPSRKQREEMIAILDGIPGIKSVQSISSRQLGPYQALNLTLGMDGTISVREGDDLATRAEKALEQRWDTLRDIHIHYHPVDRFPAVSVQIPD
ncbi:MAG: cation transporter [Anaerolineales bacterium]|nr:cation transporter [Anaerolineales bacterium]